ncbi:MAG: DUF4845 domain-containing protein [Chromatiales bacterium]|nr:DUF4845 domain-containing protein [Chromatiales bacterium]
MRARQTGVSLLGFLFVAALCAVIGFGLLKLSPIYMDNLKIQRMLADVQGQWEGQNPSVGQLRSSLESRINIESITGVTARDFNISRSEAGYLVSVSYERRTDFFGNIELVASFDESVEIRR